MLNQDKLWMHRCLQLALLGAGRVAPNPMVGAVLVHDGVIIGEGYHKKFGEAHAEVNCINSVPAALKHLISKSTLYVSLEPCCFEGKTPACTQLILDNQIPKLVVACQDPFSLVNGGGIRLLKAASVDVQLGVLEMEAAELNKVFFCFHQKQRPYICLKWAQTNDFKIAKPDFSPLKITNALTDNMLHKMRSNFMAIMVGVHTVLTDNPSLTNRRWYGNNPVRLVLDKSLQIKEGMNIYNDEAETLIFNFVINKKLEGIEYILIDQDLPLNAQMMEHLYKRNINGLIVEGGAALLQSFIDDGLWDEACVITNQALKIGAGIAAPILSNAKRYKLEKFYSDEVSYYYND